MPKQINSFSGKNEKGFTLVEILVSLVILLILVVAFVPLFTFVAQAVSNNSAKDTATALANQQIEYLRTLPFVVKKIDGQIETDPNVLQLGFIGGNPPGSIPAADAVKIQTVNGKQYTIKTDISWDESRKHKKISVSVEYPSAFNSSTSLINKFYTLAAEEGEIDYPKAGNIRVQIFDKAGSPFKSKDILVKVVDSDGFEQLNYTESGEKLFGILEAGYYTVYAQISDDISYRPNQMSHDGWLVLSDIQVDDNVTKNARFYIDLPGKLNLELTDSGASIVGNGSLDLIWTDSLETEHFIMDFKANDFSNKVLTSSTLKNKIGNLWPGGSYMIKLDNVLDSTTLKAYYDYDMSKTDTPNPILNDGSSWNGTFDSADSTIKISVELFSALKTHLDASKGVTTEPDTYTDDNTGEIVTVNRIVNWEDQSGNNCYASPSDDNAPNLVDNAVNDLPAIMFTKNQKNVLVLNMPAIPHDSRPSDDFTIFVVAKPSDTHPIDILGDQYGGVTDATREAQNYLLYPEHGQTRYVGQGLSLGSNGLSCYEHGKDYMPPTAIYTGDLSVFNILGVRYKDKYPNLIINGSALGNSWVPNDSWHPREHVYAPKGIGGEKGGYGYFDGYLAEILIYDYSFNEANIKLVSDSLKSKYNL